MGLQSRVSTAKFCKISLLLSHSPSMHGLTRNGIKHVCSSCLLRSQRQNVTELNASIYPLSSTSKITADGSSIRGSYRVAGFSSSRQSRTSDPVTVSYVSPLGAETKSSIVLTKRQRETIRAVHRLKRLIAAGTRHVSSVNGKGSSNDELTLDAVVSSLAVPEDGDQKEILRLLKQEHGDKPVTAVEALLRKVASHRASSNTNVADAETIEAMAAWGIVDRTKLNKSSMESPQNAAQAAGTEPATTPSFRNPPKKGVLMSALNAAQESRKAKIAAKASNKVSPKQLTASRPAADETAEKHSMDPRDLVLEPLTLDDNGQRIPQLSFDLSRVLFNPGIYQLQDPRSRVFNFDPYLAEPMPVSEFNFRALNAYITSSKDQTLIAHALAHDKRYIGSSSSMSGALCQFHFLLSQFRPLNTANLTRGFGEERTDFTAISKAPAAIFLRWRDGVYAVDADKEFDEPNVLLSLGKSMEKLLTLEKAEFEKWRKTGTTADETFMDPETEAYHYSTQGDFLLRSQLDAVDPRLPGTGVFDLKTRAVAGIRMNIQDHESGMGYQIRNRFGTWESFEREYYDMMRSAFLKYSMQVRMGNMDGIFVAYHNIQRLFGFQYIPITELDLALHGQSDPSIGDQEFRMSVGLLGQIFDKVTWKFPKQSVRFHFETRDISAREPKPYMHVFAEPMTDEEIDAIQVAQDSEFEAYESKVTEGAPVEDIALPDGAQNPPPLTEREEVTSQSTLNLADEAPELSQSSESSDANSELLDRVLKQVSPDTEAPKPRPLLALKLVITNKVNGVVMARPEQITTSAKWTTDYTVHELGDNEARKAYIGCKNRRTAALRTSAKQSRGFLSALNELSRSGAAWRQEQDQIDAQRERVVLYPIE